MTTIPSMHQPTTLQVPANVSRMISDLITRSRRTRLRAGAVLAIAAALLLVLIAIGLDWSLVLFDSEARVQLTTATVVAMLVLALACLAWAWRLQITSLDAARKIDQQNPQLEERWTSVTEFSRRAAGGGLHGSEALIQKVAEEAELMGRIVDPGKVPLGKELHVAVRCLGVVALLWLAALAVDPALTTTLVHRFLSPKTAISLTQLRSETGNITHARGADLKLEASIKGRLLQSAVLSILKEDGIEESLPLELVNGETPRFIYPLKNLQESFSYRFRSGDGQTSWHKVNVAERPKLSKVDFRIIPPAYSKLPELHQDGLPKSVQALEGSRLILNLESSVPLKSLVLQGEDTTSYGRLETVPAYRWEIDLTKSWSFRPILESEHGLFNDQPPRCEIVVYQDQAPVVSIADPTNDIAVHPEDTVTIAFDAKDDLGVSHAELVIFDGSGENSQELKTIPIPLKEQTGAASVHSEIELGLKEFQLKHGQELSYAIRVYDTKQKATLQHPADTAAATTGSLNASSGTTSPPQDSAVEADKSLAAAEDDPTQQSEAASAKQDDSENSPQKAATDGQQSPEAESASPEKKTGSGNQWSPKSQGGEPQKSQPGSQIEGKPRPDFYMAKNELDTPPGQCSSCGRRRITIDEWAGSYTSQVLDKLQLQIDPVLKEMKQVLAEARKTLQPVSTRLKAGAPWETTDSIEVRKADELLIKANAAVTDLTQKSEGTPYVFIGLQLQDIARLHIQPARERLMDVTLLDSPGSEDDLTASDIHIERAIALLEKLTQQYETAKLNQKLADTMTRIRKMHQIFLEGTFAMLNSQKPSLNPKQRAFMELELTDEFLQRLQQLLKKKLEIQAELAKVLSQDPRLLERFMARSRLEATTLRDQLTLLRDRQQKLTVEVQHGLRKDNDVEVPGAAPELNLDEYRIPNRVADARRIADDAARMLENYVVWTPKELNVNEGDLSIFRSKGVRIAAIASDLAALAADDDPTSALDAAGSLYEQLQEFLDSLPDLLTTTEHPKMASHITWRMQEAETLITEVSGWIRKERAMKAGQHHLAAEVDQHRMAVDAMELTRKLTSLEAQCQGISPTLFKSANAFLSTMEDDLIPELEESQIQLSDNKIRKALEHQTAALQHFAKAEQQLDEVMEGIIKYLDSLPFNPTPTLADDAEPESLEELLAMLEDEARAAEALGIPCCRPSNLVMEKDWSKPGSSAGSGGSSGSGSGGRMLQARGPLNQAKEAGKLAGRIRQQLDDSMKRLAKGSGGANSRATAQKSERAWDTLGSKLEDHIRQGRGNLPPEHYRKAIEQYFETLAGKPSENNLKTGSPD